MPERDRKLDFIINFFYYALIIAICVALFFYILPLFWPFIMGLALAHLFNKLSSPMVHKMRISSKPAIIAIAVIFYIIVALLFWVLLAFIFDKVMEIARWVPTFYVNNLSPLWQILKDYFINSLDALAPALAISVGDLFNLIASSLSNLVKTLSSALVSLVKSTLSGLPIFLVGFLFMLISSFYIGLDYKNVTTFLVRQIPDHFRIIAFDVKNFLISCLGRLLRAYGIIMVITFCELSIGLWVLQVDDFLKIAATIAALDILPMIGSGLILIPWGIYNLILGELWLGIGILILYLLITFIRNIIEPRIVGDQLELPPVVTLVAMFLGMRTMGVVGIFLMPILVLLLRFLNSSGKIRLYRD